MPANEPFLSTYYRAMGPFYVLALMGSALFAFALVIYFVTRGRGAMAGGAMLLAALLPFLIGLYGTFDGAIASYRVVMASTSMPKPSELADGAWSSLVTTQVGLVFSLPSILIAVVGTVVRTFMNRDEEETKT